MALQTFVDTHVKFGTFVIPNILLRPTQQSGVRMRTAATPNREGLYSAGGVRDAHRVHAVGRIVLAPGDNMDDAWRELVAGLPYGVFDKLYTRQDDTSFRWAEVESLDPGESNEGSALDYSVSFLCTDPFEYAAGLSSGLRTGAGNLTVANAGPLVTPPTIEVIVASVVGANPSVTLTNSTTGKDLTIHPPAAATYTLDHRLRTVTRSTGGDARPDLDAASIFFDLAPGNNTIEVAINSDCTVGNTTVSWRSRWA